MLRSIGRNIEILLKKDYIKLKDDKLFLAVVTGVKGRVSLLFTVGAKQKIPFCSKYSSSKCLCFKTLERLVNEAMEEENRMNLNEENQDNTFLWERRQENNNEPLDDCRENLSYNEHISNYGFNFYTFEYPIEKDKFISKKFLDSVNGSMTMIPDQLIPPERHDKECKHGNNFDFDDAKLILLGEAIKIFSESNEKTLKCSNFGRPSQGNCKCILQFDSHEILLWNIGGNKFVDYVFLYYALHRVMEGSPINSVYKARNVSLSSSGFTSELSYSDFLRSLTGFIGNASISSKLFICPSCGDTPSYLVGDGGLKWE